MNDAIENHANIAITWNESYVNLKDTFLAMQENLKKAEGAIMNLQKDVSRYHKIGSSLKAELEVAKAALQAERLVTEKITELLKTSREETFRLEKELAEAQAEVTRLSSEDHEDLVKTMGLVEYRDTLEYRKECCKLSEEIRADLWDRELEPQLEDVREVALRTGVSKALRLVARRLECDVSELAFEDISDDEDVFHDSDVDNVGE